MRPYRNFNLGGIGWLLVLVLLLLPIVSIGAENKETTKHEVVGKPIPQKFLDAYKHPTTQLVFFVSSSPGERQVRLFIIGGTNEDKYTGANYQTGVKLFDLDKEQELFSRNLRYLPRRILLDSNATVVILGKNWDRCNVDLFQFVDGKITLKYVGGCELGPGTIDYGEATRIDGRTIFIHMYWMNKGKGIKKRNEVIEIPYHNMGTDFPSNVLYTPKGVLTAQEKEERKEELENQCKLTLKALCSSELVYQDQNTHGDNSRGDYGTWFSLIENGYIEKGYTRSNLIENYSISVFAVSTSIGPAPSNFQAIAVPITKVYDLDIFGVGISGVFGEIKEDGKRRYSHVVYYEFKGDTAKYDWWIKNRYLEGGKTFNFDEAYWEPIR